MFFHWPWSGYYLLYILLSHLLVLNLFTSYMYMNSELFWTLRIWSSYLYTSMNPCFIQMLFCVSYVYILYMFIIEHRFRGWRYIASCDDPVGTQRCFNVEKWLKSSCNVDQPLFNVESTLRFKRWNPNHNSTLIPRWRPNLFSTLKTSTTFQRWNNVLIY